MLKHGCGALNVDGCRITADGGRPLREIDPKQTNNNAYAGRMDGSLQGGSKAVGETTLGRFPANLIHDGSPEVVALFPQTESGTLNQGSITSENRIYGKRGGYDNPTLYQGNQGSAARFFYCAKANKSDRDTDNTHPTVKPVELMRYLVRLVTPPRGVTLDPFMGSGSTGVAAVLEEARFIGIDYEPSYFEIASRRIDDAQRQQTLDLDPPDPRAQTPQ